jgi:hypothetical protein
MEKEIIKTSKTKSEAIKKIYGYYNGRTQLKFKNFVIENKINIDHLKSKPSKYEKVLKRCPVCGNEFETKVGNKEEKTTCSYSCSNTYFRSGTSNPNWKDESYRSTCFEYHNKECVICGENKIVTVHHYDKNHNNNEPKNLIPLCPIDEYRNNFIKNKRWR